MKRFTGLAALMTIACAMLVVLAGCSRSPLTAPPREGAPSIEDTAAPPSNTLVAAGHRGAGVLPLPVPLPIEWNLLIETLVRSKEDRVITGGRFALHFYPGSLESDELISVRSYDENVVDFQLGPHGTRFGTPVELSIDFTGTAADVADPTGQTVQPVLYWLNDATGRWEEVPGTTDWDTHRHVVHLEHFSRYVLGGKAGWRHTPNTEGE